MPHKIPQTNATVYSVKPQAPLSETKTDSFVPYSPSASPRGPSYCQEYQKIDSKFIYDALRAGLESIFDCLYKWLQSFIVISFAPFKPKLDHTFNPPTKYTSTFTKNESSSDKSYVDDKIKSKSRIAIIGAGITGISTAAHFLTHGFEVMIFEQSSQVGGIWSRVNSTSALQLHSIVYRFHPSVKWSRRQEVKQVES
ncbi:hypothetical protein O181_047839 [Austropuccinia psidii MF-1]|uniref:Flavin-containing monooxygenase n=1 Tax=Austropuccinia psidii MF-1 TaxID=1389203 RepID=A0A9Q3DRT6_9BASI|nr:hypothetical protein [Austropuccinia psidii MF-1]